MKKLISFSLITASFLFANGYKIPEQSLNGIALSAANIANAHGADSAYYNPANMTFNNPKKDYYEMLMTYIHLYSVQFEKSDSTTYNSRTEDFLIPQFHYASHDINGFRIGFSITSPAGLSKKWDDAEPEATAKEFTLKTIEFNPSLAYRINNNLAVAFGLRAVKSSGVVNIMIANKYSEYLNGTSIDYGWNTAIAYQNNKRDMKFAITYRSKVNLTLKGDASGYIGTYTFNTTGRVNLPIPATLDIAFSKKYNKTTFEFVFERTYWSKYKDLDFNFDDAIVENTFGKPKAKNWKNVNTYRFGITHQCTKKLIAMLGYTYDKTPIPDSTIEYSLPDSNKHIFSGGLKYNVNKNMKLGFSTLYAKQKERNVNNNYIGSGTFKKGGALLLAFGMDYSF